MYTVSHASVLLCLTISLKAVVLYMS